jgi:hypothetical protein
MRTEYGVKADIYRNQEIVWIMKEKIEQHNNQPA